MKDAFYTIGAIGVFTLILAACDAKITTNNPPDKVVEKNTTVVNPPAEKKVENNTTVVNPPPKEEKTVEKDTTIINTDKK